MNILIIGGTRFFGIHTVRRLLADGHTVTIATRGMHSDPFGSQVSRIIMDKTDENSVKQAIGGREYDVIIDKVAYSSNDVRSLLQFAHCGRYIQMSSCAVYKTEHLQITEDEFVPQDHALCWIDRPADYAEGKRQAERAALEFMEPKDCTFVRYPVVLGKNDYTNRLRFYIDHIRRQIPMCADSTAAVSYIHEKEAGEFLAFLADHPVSGAVNGCAAGIISQQAIIRYIEEKTQKHAVLSADGEPAPYNGTRADTSYNCAKAEAADFAFSKLDAWIFALLDADIEKS
ncbi:MAG: NAD-dependent epimerase/dehydratase family protein [Oscillospiraceae bacterium]|nr:NAD-dependent epimerase/dehydratase family protein [Oscillospiraceae bacterium]